MFLDESESEGSAKISEIANVVQKSQKDESHSQLPHEERSGSFPANEHREAGITFVFPSLHSAAILRKLTIKIAVSLAFDSQIRC